MRNNYGVFLEFVCLIFFVVVVVVLNLSANCLSTQVPEEVWKKKNQEITSSIFSSAIVLGIWSLLYWDI